MGKVPGWLISGIAGVFVAAAIVYGFFRLDIVDKSNLPIVCLTALLAVFSVILACGTIYLAAGTRDLAKETRRALDAADIHHQELLSPMLKVENPEIEAVAISGKVLYRLFDRLTNAGTGPAMHIKATFKDPVGKELEQEFVPLAAGESHPFKVDYQSLIDATSTTRFEWELRISYTDRFANLACSVYHNRSFEYRPPHPTSRELLS